MRQWRGVVAALALLAFPVRSGEVEINVRMNPLQGILDLAYSYCGGPYESPALQAVLEAAGHRSGEAPESIVRFCMTDIHRGGEGIPGRGQIYDTGWRAPWNRFTRASVLSADISGFTDATSGVFSAEEQQAVIDAMREMTPVYDTYIAKSFGEQANQMAGALARYLDDNDFGAMLGAMSRLYSVDWPADRPLWVGLSAIPPGGTGFSATIEGDVVRSFMPVDFDKPEVYAGVIAHEYGHALFSGLSDDSIRMIHSAFAASSSSGRRFAEVWMNEALATAAGNGWVHRKLAGRENDSQWYDDPVIDPYAKAISSVVHAALDSGRTVDEELVNAFIDAFDQAFPDAIDLPDVVLPHAILLVTGPKESHALLESVYRNRVRVRAMRNSLPSYEPDEISRRLPTVLRVAVGEVGVEASSWSRTLLEDGGVEYSIKVASVDAFDDAVASLIAQIAARAW